MVSRLQLTEMLHIGAFAVSTKFSTFLCYLPSYICCCCSCLCLCVAVDCFCTALFSLWAVWYKIFVFPHLQLHYAKTRAVYQTFRFDYCNCACYCIVVVLVIHLFVLVFFLDFSALLSQFMLVIGNTCN